MVDVSVHLGDCTYGKKRVSARSFSLLVKPGEEVLRAQQRIVNSDGKVELLALTNYRWLSAVFGGGDDGSVEVKEVAANTDGTVDFVRCGDGEAFAVAKVVKGRCRILCESGDPWRKDNATETCFTFNLHHGDAANVKFVCNGDAVVAYTANHFSVYPCRGSSHGSGWGEWIGGLWGKSEAQPAYRSESDKTSVTVSNLNITSVSIHGRIEVFSVDRRLSSFGDASDDVVVRQRRCVKDLSMLRYSAHRVWSGVSSDGHAWVLSSTDKAEPGKITLLKMYDCDDGSCTDLVASKASRSKGCRHCTLCDDGRFRCYHKGCPGVVSLFGDHSAASTDASTSSSRPLLPSRDPTNIIKQLALAESRARSESTLADSAVSLVTEVSSLDKLLAYVDAVVLSGIDCATLEVVLERGQERADVLECSREYKRGTGLTRRCLDGYAMISDSVSGLDDDGQHCPDEVATYLTLVQPKPCQAMTFKHLYVTMSRNSSFSDPSFVMSVYGRACNDVFWLKELIKVEKVLKLERDSDAILRTLFMNIDPSDLTKNYAGVRRFVCELAKAGSTNDDIRYVARMCVCVF